MSTRKIFAIFKKQVKETFKNKEILIQFLMFPIITVILSNAMNIKGMPENYFVHLFATMYIGMAPLVCMASIISEEKEGNTLRVLVMSNVHAIEYLIGIGSYVMLLCMTGGLVFAIQGHYTGAAFAKFMLIMFLGFLTSMIIGAVVGIWCKNQMAATSITVPVMMVFAFMPMIASVNEKFMNVSRFLYTQQLNFLINNAKEITVENILVISVNATIAVVLFVYAYRKKQLV